MPTRKNELNKDDLLELSKEFKSFEQKETSEKNNIKTILYPSLIAFVILAVYAFYLIQSLTTDVDAMSTSLLSMTESVSKNMDLLSATTIEMSQSMDKMLGNIDSMSQSTKGISNNMGGMTQTISALQAPMDDMNLSTQQMQLDVHSLDQSISKPLRMFNQFIPWTSR